MGTEKTNLIAHLYRRAGFGATRSELEQYSSKEYSDLVENLLHPKDPNNMPDDVIRRFDPGFSEMRHPPEGGTYLMYRMITTNCPLEDKLALFWHGLFAVAYSKLNHTRAIINQIETFRRHALGKFDQILLELSKDPAMLLWLDNNNNHNGSINENYGRELLELFAMGIGNYTEDDVKECSRAFTGWTVANAEYMETRMNKDSIWPYGRINWHFEYRENDHDNETKTFLGETGNFNGEEVIGIIVRQKAAAEFICTRLFQFFASDEVSSKGQEAIDQMIKSYYESNYEIRSVLRTLFNSDYFKSKDARFSRVKNPVELVVGAIRTAGTYRSPTLGADQLANYTWFMGQGLVQPPSVEGWHEGVEWIDSGTLVERINFVAGELSNINNPGVRSIIEDLRENNDGPISSEKLVDQCIDLVGPMDVSAKTRDSLMNHADAEGVIDLTDKQKSEESEQRIGTLLRLITSTREYQLA